MYKCSLLLVKMELISTTLESARQCDLQNIVFYEAIPACNSNLKLYFGEQYNFFKLFKNILKSSKKKCLYFKRRNNGAGCSPSYMKIKLDDSFSNK